MSASSKNSCDLCRTRTLTEIKNSSSMVPIVQALRNQLSRRQHGLSPQAYDLQDLLKQTVAVDGTFLHAVADVAWAIANSNNHGVKRHRACLDAHLNVSTTFWMLFAPLFQCLPIHTTHTFAVPTDITEHHS